MADSGDNRNYLPDQQRTKGDSRKTSNTPANLVSDRQRERRAVDGILYPNVPKSGSLPQTPVYTNLRKEYSTAAHSGSRKTRTTSGFPPIASKSSQRGATPTGTPMPSGSRQSSPHATTPVTFFPDESSGAGQNIETPSRTKHPTASIRSTPRARLDHSNPFHGFINPEIYARIQQARSNAGSPRPLASSAPQTLVDSDGRDAGGSNSAPPEGSRQPSDPGEPSRPIDPAPSTPKNGRIDVPYPNLPAPVGDDPNFRRTDIQLQKIINDAAFDIYQEGNESYTLLIGVSPGLGRVESVSPFTVICKDHTQIHAGGPKRVYAKKKELSNSHDTFVEFTKRLYNVVARSGLRKHHVDQPSHYFLMLVIAEEHVDVVSVSATTVVTDRKTSFEIGGSKMVVQQTSGGIFGYFRPNTNVRDSEEGE